MTRSRTLWALCIALAMLAGCKQRDDAQVAPEAQNEAEAGAAVDAASAPAEQAPSEPTAAQAPSEPPAATAAAPDAKAFDINTIPVSDQPLPAWPYVALPAGYEFDHADDLAQRSKDLARVAVWSGGQLLWVEGRVFEDQIDNADGKTYSRFEVRKNVQQAVEALGGVRVSERSFDEATYKANEKDLEDFRQEFSSIRDAYWYGNDADTYVIRRADKAIWVVFQSSNSQGALMVAEGPLPAAPAG
ncbi:hypothetical protein [Luteimonas notoginsengisoli]|uniref:Lipoprotein n=1 Tax=Luteimonas notoginsengisoli TaxID=1578200 RepID=A0ABV7UU97_9GAMM